MWDESNMNFREETNIDRLFKITPIVSLPPRKGAKKLKSNRNQPNFNSEVWTSTWTLKNISWMRASCWTNITSCVSNIEYWNWFCIEKSYACKPRQSNGWNSVLKPVNIWSTYWFRFHNFQSSYLCFHFNPIANQNDSFTVWYKLTPHLLTQARVRHDKRVLVNLGANVFVDFTLEELPQLLEQQLAMVEKSTKVLEEQMAVVNDQILTIKGNMAKVHRWKLKQDKMRLLQKKKKPFNLNEYMAAAAVDPFKLHNA